MGEMRKVTVSLPADLIDLTVAGTGRGLTETLRAALEELAHRQACDRLLDLRGKVKFDISYEETVAWTRQQRSA